MHYTASGTVAADAAAGSDAATEWVAHPTRTATDTSTSQALTGLANDASYYRVRVRARNAAGAGAWVHGRGMPQQTDTTGPSAPAFVPGGGTTVTDAGTNITLTFTEMVRKDASNTDFTGHADLAAILTLARTNASGTAIPYTASINAEKTVITLDPTDDLAEGAVYVGISGAYYDTNGNAGSAASATFTVARQSTPSATPIWSAKLTAKDLPRRGLWLPQRHDRRRVQLDFGADGRRLHGLGHALGDNEHFRHQLDPDG